MKAPEKLPTFPPLRNPGRGREEERGMDLVDVRGVLGGVAGGGAGPPRRRPRAPEGRRYHGLQLARDDVLLHGLRLRRRAQLRHLPHQLRRDRLLPGNGDSLRRTEFSSLRSFETSKNDVKAKTGAFGSDL